MSFVENLHEELRKGIDDLSSQLNYYRALQGNPMPPVPEGNDLRGVSGSAGGIGYGPPGDLPSPIGGTGAISVDGAYGGGGSRQASPNSTFHSMAGGVTAGIVNPYSPITGEYEKQLMEEQERELRWQQEFANRSTQINDEKQKMLQRRLKREMEREEWERKQREREEAMLRLEWDEAERNLELDRAREFEDEKRHEMERELAFRRDLELEQELQRRTLEAMDLDHGAATQRLAGLLSDNTVNEVIKYTYNTTAPDGQLNVTALLDHELIEDEREKMKQRDRQRIEILHRERERQRELERAWAKQRLDDKMREEDAKRVKYQVAKGEVMNKPMLLNLKSRIVVEDEKDKVPSYVIASLLRTIDESNDKAAITLCVNILHRLVHGPSMERKKRTVEAMVTSYCGLRPLVRVLNQYYSDTLMMQQIMALLKLGASFSRTFAVSALQHGFFDVANAVSVAGLRPERFRDITAFTPRQSDSEAHAAVEALQQLLAINPPDNLQCLKVLTFLQLELQHRPPADDLQGPLLNVLMDSGIMVRDDEASVWKPVLQLLMQLIGIPDRIARVAEALSTVKGHTFLSHLLLMLTLSHEDATILLAVDFLTAMHQGPYDLSSVFLEAHVLSALIASTETHPHLRDGILQRWETSGIGNNDVRELLEDISNCEVYNYDLKAHLFDLSVRFHPSQSKRGIDLSELAIAFLSDGRGAAILKKTFVTFPRSREAVLHVLWSMIQVQDSLQFSARLAEDITDSGLLGHLVDFTAEPECQLPLGHCIEVLEFCVDKNVDSHILLQRGFIPQLEAAYALAQRLPTVLEEAVLHLNKLLRTLGIVPAEHRTLNEVFAILPSELSESSIQTVVTNLRLLQRPTIYRSQWRSNGGFRNAIELLLSFQGVPEVETECIHLFSQYISVDDGLNVSCATEFADAGGIDCLLQCISRYEDNESLTTQCWEVLYHVSINAGPVHANALKSDERLPKLLALTRSGARLLPLALRDANALDLLHEVIDAIHFAEESIDSAPTANPNAADSTAINNATATAEAPVGAESAPNQQAAAKLTILALKADPALERLAVAAYMLINFLSAHLITGTANAAGGAVGLLRERDQIVDGRLVDAIKAIEEGAAHKLCRCLEASSGRLPEPYVLDLLTCLIGLLTLGREGRGNGADRLNASKATQNATVVVGGGEEGLVTLHSAHRTARTQTHAQVKQRVETLIYAMTAYLWSKNICAKAATALYLLLAEVDSLEADDLAARLLQSQAAEACFECWYEHGLHQSILGIVQIIGTVESWEPVLWQLGSVDAAYASYHLFESEIVRAQAVGCLANHASLSPARRTTIGALDGLGMARNLIRHGAGTWEESYAAMCMIAALAEPSEASLCQTLGDGIHYKIAECISSFSAVAHTRAAARCLCRLLIVGLTYRHALKEQRRASTPTAGSTRPDGSVGTPVAPASMTAVQGSANLRPWITDDALSCALELLAYRVHQLFSNRIVDLETVNYTTQYISRLMGMQSHHIMRRLLRCNTRLLLSNIVACETLTPFIARDARRCLEELHAYAMHLSKAAPPGYVPVEDVIPVTEKPRVPAQPMVPTALEAAEGMVPMDQPSRVTLSRGGSRPDTAITDMMNMTGAGGYEPHDEEYLGKVGVKSLYEEMVSVLLSHKPSKVEVYQFLQNFLASKHRQGQPTPT